MLQIAKMKRLAPDFVAVDATPTSDVTLVQGNYCLLKVLLWLDALSRGTVAPPVNGYAAV